MRRVALFMLALSVVAVPAAAQEEAGALVAVQEANPGQAQQKPGQAQQKPAPTAEAKQETPRQIPPPEPNRGQLTNVRLEVTITDQRGSGQPTTKTVALVLADRSPGRLRTSGDVRTPQGYRPIALNIDARPEFTRDGRVRANVTLDYRPSVGEGTSEEQVLTTITESFEVILEDGKALIVSQSADPYSDRRVRVELKATVLK